MKKVIGGDWTLRRVLYVVLGIFVIAYAIAVQRYWGALLGVYFAVMGVLNFGCASGNCAVPASGSASAPEQPAVTEGKNE